MNKKKLNLVITTTDANGNRIDALSFENGHPEMIGHILPLMRLGYSCLMELEEVEIPAPNE